MQHYSEDQIKKAFGEVEARQLEGFLYQLPTSGCSESHSRGGLGKRNRSVYKNRSRSYHSRNKDHSSSCRSRKEDHSCCCPSDKKDYSSSCRSHSKRNKKCCKRKRRDCAEDVFYPTSQTRYWDQGNMYLLRQQR